MAKCKLKHCCSVFRKKQKLVEMAKTKTKTKTEGRMSVIGNLSNNVAIKFNKCALIRAHESQNKI